MLEVLQNRPESLGQGLDSLSKPVQKPVATPSKAKLAEKWLLEHEEHILETGQWLQGNCKPMGIEISYRTWNRVKKRLKGKG